MKKILIKCCVGLIAIVTLAGCAASRAEVASDSVSMQLQPTPGMKKINVTVVLEDKRPQSRQIRYGSGNFERPERYFNNTINLTGYTLDYLSRIKIFKSVSTVRKPGNYTLKLIWRSAHLNVNSWIPFVVRFQNHMTIDMELLTPAGKVIWKHRLDGFVVNTPSSFRHFSSHRCDIFQERVLHEHYPEAFQNMCESLAGKLK